MASEMESHNNLGANRANCVPRTVEGNWHVFLIMPLSTLHGKTSDMIVRLDWLGNHIAKELQNVKHR